MDGQTITTAGSPEKPRSEEKEVANDNTGKTDDQDAEKQKEEERQKAEDLETITAFIAELTSRFEAKRDERLTHESKSIDYPDEAFFGRLDSSIKKNTALVKKLRNMTEAQRDVILKDLASLNLSRYVSELASALVETKLKLTEISLAVKISSFLHRRYADFSGQLLDAWTKALPRKPTDTFNAAKMRIDIRLFTELILSGIFTPKEALPLLGGLLTFLTTTDKETHSNLSIILGFCKQYGNEFAGLVPRKMRLLAEANALSVPICDFLSAERQKGVRNLLKDYFTSLVAHLQKDQKRLLAMESEMRRVLVTRGEVSKHQKELYEGRSVEFKKLWTSAEQFADVLDEELPEFAAILGDGMGDGLDGDGKDVVFDFSNRFTDASGCPQTALWEDEETRTFYENLPDLKSIIPAILYKDSLKDAQSTTTQTATESSSLVNGNSGEGETGDNNKAEEAPSGEASKDEEKKEDVVEDEMAEEEEDFADSGKDMANLNENDELEIALNAIQKTEEKQKQKTAEGGSSGSAEKEAEEASKAATKGVSTSSTSTKSPVDVFFGSLLKCVNRDFIDKAALTFATTYNTKSNRKKLVNILFIVPRTRLDLLPFYARFVAQLNPIMPTVGADLVAILKSNFRYLFKKKDQINIESKVKNIRFVGELVKFGVFPKPDALYILKTLLSDFRHHHIEMACNLLETAGQYLYRSPDSYPMTSHLLDQLMRHKSRLALDSRYAIMVENAYYVVNPPEDKLLGRNIPNKPPLHLYIDHLIYTELTKTTTSKVLIKLRKLNWADPETSSYAIEALASVWKLKYYNIIYLAHLLFGLYAYQEWVVPRVLDTVLEDIRLGLQMNATEFNQRRISVIKFFAECFNYRLIDSGLLFRVLYLLITYGVNYEDVRLSALDPPANLMRLRLAAQILHTCGGFLTSGLSRKKLEYYLYFYQRYYWLKKDYLNSLVAAESSQPATEQQPKQQSSGGGGNTNNPELNAQFYIDSIFRDVLTYLKPKWKVAESYEAACRLLESHLKEVAEKAKELMPNSSLSLEQVLKPSTIVQQPNSQAEAHQNRRKSSVALEPIVEESADSFDEDGGPSSALNGGDHHLVGDNESQDGGFDEETAEGGYPNSEDEEEEAEEEVGGAEEDLEAVNESSASTKVPTIVPCTEDDEFQRDFERMLSESMTNRSQEVVRPNVEIVIPIERGEKQRKKNIGNTFADDEEAGRPFSMALNDHTSSGAANNNTTFEFRVMARNAKSNKPLFRSIEVSPESELVQNFLAREEELRAQKEAVKRVILDINQRRELEDSSPNRSADGGGFSFRGGRGGGQYPSGHYHPAGGQYRQGGPGYNNTVNSVNNPSTDQNTVNYQQYRRRFN